MMFGVNKEGLISAVLIVAGVIAYSFVGGKLPKLPFSTILYPIIGVVLIVTGIHMNHMIGDALIGFGAGMASQVASALSSLKP